MAWFKSSKKKDTKLEENEKKIINDDKPAPIYDDVCILNIKNGFWLQVWAHRPVNADIVDTSTGS